MGRCSLNGSLWYTTDSLKNYLCSYFLFFYLFCYNWLRFFCKCRTERRKMWKPNRRKQNDRQDLRALSSPIVIPFLIDIFFIVNLITSLPCLKPFSCFLACKLYCKFLKCVFRLLISWPSLLVPLLECNTSSYTNYASKGKICISNSWK